MRARIPDSPDYEDAAEFVLWAAAQLKLNPVDEEGAVVIELDEESQPDFDGQQHLRLQIAAAADDPAAEPIAWDSRFGQWLRGRLQGVDGALHTRPVVQPQSVNDISERLFAAYVVEGGKTHLAGCQLTDHPFLRLSFVDQQHPESAVRHAYVAPDGSTVDDALVNALGMDELESCDRQRPRIEPVALRSLIAAGRRIAAKQSSRRDPTATTVDALAVAVIWVRHATGRLQFSIGDATASLEFSGWAKLLAPKPFVGKQSGRGAFHLAATDDGRIDAADEIETCQQSDRRVLRQELVECCVTGSRVLPEFTQLCPVAGMPAMLDEFDTCAICQQSVSRTVLDGDECQACRRLEKIRKDDPRL
ncbi:MAG: hypothetical protein AAF961_02915, partial [Planctomycetota bacterium]